MSRLSVHLMQFNNLSWACELRQLDDHFETFRRHIERACCINSEEC
jgi:hypothetical protein